MPGLLLLRLDCLHASLRQIRTINEVHNLTDWNSNSNARVKVRIYGHYFLRVVITDKIFGILAAVKALHHSDQKIRGVLTFPIGSRIKPGFWPSLTWVCV